jgi:GTPase SAR1 family protein
MRYSHSYLNPSLFVAKFKNINYLNPTLNRLEEMEGSSMKNLRAFIDKLAQGNIRGYVSIPEIAVMGDTSSGKSSLLSAISGIEFPANAELTTRCPTRLRMHKSSTNQITATIGINWDIDSGHYKADFEPIQLEGAGVFHEISGAIQRVQAFIIEKSNKLVAFDTIEITISTPNALDLTLTDLPGIVRVVGKNENESIIQDIRTMIDRFLTNPRCILLVVIPANVDFHNS